MSKSKIKISEVGLRTEPSAFSVLVDNSYPTDTEKKAILAFADAREKCMRIQTEVYTRHGETRPSYGDGFVPNLLAQLYNRQITYAQYGAKQDELNNFESELIQRINRGEVKFSKFEEVYRNKMMQILNSGEVSQLPVPSPRKQDQSNADLVAECKRIMMGRPTKTGSFAESISNAAQCDVDSSAFLKQQPDMYIRCEKNISGVINCN